MVTYQEQATLELWTLCLPVFLDRFMRLAPDRARVVELGTIPERMLKNP